MKTRALFSLLPALFLMACGGGGGSSSTFTPSNGAPAASPSNPGTPATPGNPGSPTVLTSIEVRSMNAATRHVSTPASSVSVLQLEVTNTSAQNAQLNGLTLQAQGDLDDAVDVGDVVLALDSNGNGQLDTGETVLGTNRFQTNDGPVQFSGISLALAAGQSRALLVSVNLPMSGARARRFATRLETAADIDISSPNATVVIQGAPVMSPWLSMGEWTAPRELISLPVEVLEPRLVADGRGNLLMTFFRNHNFRSDVYYSYFNGRFWSQPFNVSNVADTSWHPDIAVDSNGTPSLIWEQMTQATGNRDIYFSRFDPSSFSWTNPINIGDPTIDQAAPKIEVDGNDVVHVIWEEAVAGFNQDIVHRSFDGTSWSTPVNLSNSAVFSAQPAIGTNTSGDVAVAWQEPVGLEYEIAFRAMTNGAFGAQESVFRDSNPVSEPCVSALPGSDWVVAMTAIDLAGQGVFLSTRSAGVFSPPSRISQIQSLGERADLIRGSGNTLFNMAWRETDNNGDSDIFTAKFDGNAWSSPENVSKTPGTSVDPSLALLGHGEPIVMYNDRISGAFRIYESHIDPSGWESSRAMMQTPTSLSGAEMAPDRQGGIHAVWDAEAGGNIEIFHSYHDGVSWSAPENISRSAGRSSKPRVDVAADGSVHVLFEENDNGTFEIAHVILSNGAWSRFQLVQLSAVQSYSPVITSLDNGAMLAAWSEEQSAGHFDIVTALYQSGQWSTPSNVSQSPDSSFQARFASTGNSAALIWQETIQSQPMLVLSEFNGQLFAAPTVLGAGKDADLAFDRSKQLHIVFGETMNNLSTVRHMLKAPGATPSSPTNLSSSAAPTFFPRLAIAGDDVHVVWEDQANGDAEIYFSTLNSGAFTTPQNIANTPGHSNSPSIMVDTGGILHVFWNEQENGVETLTFVSRN
ncbi:MAG: sialidase family protein [Planctomycetota bacterium]|nr:sialidase family protein [Planctomycetota bacterium]